MTGKGDELRPPPAPCSVVCPAHRFFPLDSLRSLLPGGHVGQPRCGHGVALVALRGPALSCCHERDTWKSTLRHISFALPKETHRNRAGHCNPRGSSYLQEEGTKGRMWDSEPTLLMPGFDRMWSSTGAGGWDEPGSLFSAVTQSLMKALRKADSSLPQ